MQEILSTAANARARVNDMAADLMACYYIQYPGSGVSSNDRGNTCSVISGGPNVALHGAEYASPDLGCVGSRSVDRGTNENTNGLLRQYLPKKSDLSLWNQEQLNEIALRLNQRPRKTLSFRTPAEVLSSSVALTG